MNVKVALSALVLALPLAGCSMLGELADYLDDTGKADYASSCLVLETSPNDRSDYGWRNTCGYPIEVQFCVDNTSNTWSCRRGSSYSTRGAIDLAGYGTKYNDHEYYWELESAPGTVRYAACRLENTIRFADSSDIRKGYSCV